VAMQVIVTPLRVDPRHRLADSNIRIVQDRNEIEPGTKRVLKVNLRKTGSDAHLIGQSGSGRPAPGRCEKSREDVNPSSRFAAEDGGVRGILRSAAVGGEAKAEGVPGRGQVIQPSEADRASAAVVLPSSVFP